MARNFFGRVRRRFREYADLCLKSGFMPRRVRLLQLLGKYLARLWMFVQIGRIRIVGAENLLAEGRIIFCPNHSSMFDAPIVYSIMKRQPRYMTAYEQMQGLRGIKAVFMGAFGCFAVDRSRGRTVIEPAVQTLVRGEYLVIFPEGKISESGQYLPFKSGSARIAIAACERLGHGEKVGIVPINICYGRRDTATAGSGFGNMGLRWRFGATVTVGAPIYIHEVTPMTAKKVTHTVRDAIVRQSCATNFEPQDN